MDQGFPGQHTTTTTVTTNTTIHQTNIRFDPSYIRTLPGLLKTAQVVLNLLGFISMSVSTHGYESRATFFNTIAMFGFWCTGILLALYLFHVVEKFYRIPWIKIEFIFCTAWTVAYLLAASFAAGYTKYVEGYGAAAFFGFCAMVAYGFDAWTKYTALRTGAPAQGQHESSKQESTMTSPAY